MKKETVPIILFYILYFVWIFTVVYLTTQTRLLTYFSLGVVLFYFAFLREKKDAVWFITSAFAPIIITIVSFENVRLNFNPELILYMPLWLPLAWGTTVVALRKFYLVVMNSL